jgi:glycosyltransferase involved in cell wall biosynthesis
MKIVRIIARLNVGGPARHVVWLEEGLRRAGVESVLVTGVVPEGEDDMTYFAAARGVEPVVIPEMSREVSPKDAVTVWKLYRLLRRERPDVVHTHTAKAGTVGRAAGFLYRWLTPGTLAGRPRRVRFVHTYHGHIFHSYYGRLKTRLFLSVERLLARMVSDRIVVISRQQFREIHEEFGVGRRGQFRVVPLGLELSQFDSWAERREAARARFGAVGGDVLVGIVGRLTEIKNHEMFLEAAGLYLRGQAAAGGAARRVRFLVIGDGHLRAPLEGRARALGLGPDAVTFTGTLDDPENFYPALDVVTLTSLNEGTPLTLIEAMANARAVIATGVGGVVDLLGETEARLGRHEGGWHLCERGVLVGRGDARAFAHGLDYLVEHTGVRAELGARGREFVAREYSLGRLLADVSRLYSELAGGAISHEGAPEASGTPAGPAVTAAPRAGARAARLKGD